MNFHGCSKALSISKFDGFVYEFVLWSCSKGLINEFILPAAGVFIELV